MAKPVTLTQLNEWLALHINKTWFTGGLGGADYNGGFSGKPGSTPLIKYVTPRVDCRDMEVYAIEFSGSMPESIYVSERDEFDGTILDLFESKFPEEFKKS